jgi:ribosome biogenesis GTPase
MEDFSIAALRRIGFTQHFLAQLGDLPSSQRPARVTVVNRDRADVHDGASLYSVRSAPGCPALAVGDWVLVHDGWIVRLLDPVNRITRRQPGGAVQLVAANIDTALLVMGLDHDFSPRRIERYIAASHAAAVAPVVVLTKQDSGIDVDQRIGQLRRRLPPSVQIAAVNGLHPTARDILAPWLGAGQTLALLGSSGAGKSTLTNTLCGAGQETGAVRADDSRGRHTTTARSLHQCPDGACVIDTPGLRALAADADADAVAASFDDIEQLARDCRFHDCSHGSEPGCAVRGRVDQDRIDNFGKLLREARRHEQTPLERIAERARWKSISRAASARSKSKRS